MKQVLSGFLAYALSILSASFASVCVCVHVRLASFNIQRGKVGLGLSLPLAESKVVFGLLRTSWADSAWPVLQENTREICSRDILEMFRMSSRVKWAPS